PRPAAFLTICFWSPWPKAPSSVTATVPQTIPKIVSEVRSFWLRMSRSICRTAPVGRGVRFEGGVVRVIRIPRGSGNLLGRPFHDLGALLEAVQDLDVHAVGNAELDRGFLRLFLGGRAGQLDGGLLAAVLEEDDALGQHEDVFLLADDEIGVGGV